MFFIVTLAFLGLSNADPNHCQRLATSGAFTPFHIADPLTNISATLIPYGATMTHLYVPDRTGILRDVLLGFDDATQYCSNSQHPYFGAQIGRVANRINNGTFTLNGTSFYLPRNENNYDNLHSGPMGFDRQVFTILNQTSSSLSLFYESPTGEEGFPGSLALTVTIQVKGHTLSMVRETGNVPVTTIYNPTFHGYFNLHGFMNNTQTILEHVLQLPNDSGYVLVDSHLIPTGQIGNVSDNVMYDFRQPKPIGRDIAGTGYDTAFCTSQAFVQSPLSGIGMAVKSDTRDNIQIYTGGYLNGSLPRKKSQSSGSNPQYYQQFSGVTFETQSYPDAINHPQWWGFTDSTIVEAGESYRETTTFTFSLYDQ